MSKVEDAEKAAEFVAGLIPAIIEHPFVFLCIIVAIAFLMCFLPNGLFSGIMVFITEKRKLDQRVNPSRKKLTSGRQNRKKIRK